MKTSLKSALLLAGVLGFGIATMLPQIAPARADEDAPAAASKEKKQHARGGHGNKMQQMLDQLGLSDEQKTQIDAIQKDSAEKRKALRANPDADKKVNRQKNMELNKETNDKIRAVLTPDQQKKLDDLIAQAKADRKANDKTKENKTARAADHRKRIAQADDNDGDAGNAGDDNNGDAGNAGDNNNDDDGNIKKPDEGDNDDAGGDN